MDTNFRAGDHLQYGYLTGSGLPMRFIDEDGEFIECFEQETLFCDDYVLVDKSFLPPLSEEQAIVYLQRVYRCRPRTTTTRWCTCISTRSTQPG